MNCKQRKHAKASASLERSADGEETHDKQTRDGDHTGVTLRAPVVRLDASMRPLADAQVSNELLQKEDVFFLLCTRLS